MTKTLPTLSRFIGKWFPQTSSSRRCGSTLSVGERGYRTYQSSNTLGSPTKWRRGRSGLCRLSNRRCCQLFVYHLEVPLYLSGIKATQADEQRQDCVCLGLHNLARFPARGRSSTGCRHSIELNSMSIFIFQ